MFEQQGGETSCGLCSHICSEWVVVKIVDNVTIPPHSENICADCLTSKSFYYVDHNGFIKANVLKQTTTSSIMGEISKGYPLPPPDDEPLQPLNIKYKSGDPVEYKGKRYDFAYYSKTEGTVIIYKQGCRNMQDSYAVPIEEIKILDE